MEAFNSSIEHAINLIVTASIHILDLVGIIIIMYSAVRTVISYFKKDPTSKLEFAENMSLALEFKLGGEILRTVIAREWNEILVVGAIIALRGFLTFLIQWEIKGEQAKLSAGVTPQINPVTIKTTKQDRTKQDSKGQDGSED